MMRFSGEKLFKYVSLSVLFLEKVQEEVTWTLQMGLQILGIR